MFLFKSFLLVTLACFVTSQCPCSTPDLCKPITKKYNEELVVFGGPANNDWKKWNWTEITHVILIGSLDAADLYCFAHSKDVRVTVLVGLSATKFDKLSNATFRKEVMNGWIAEFQKYQLDGVNIDIEGAAYTEDVIQGISDLTKETFVAIKNLNPNYVVTFDIPYSPYLIGCISGYCFDYVAISKATDYMIVMDYDATIDVLVASANSPMNLLVEAYNLYLVNLSINPHLLVMAVPWYGYDYTCSRFYNRTGDDLCVIVGTGGTQRTFSQINEMYSGNIDGLRWDEKSDSPYFMIKQNETYHQFWFDNVQSLTDKYKLANKLKLRGLSMFSAGGLDYTSTKASVVEQTTAMWNTITQYFTHLKS